MRLSFPNGEHADVLIGPTAATVGSADGNSVVIGQADVAAWHAQIIDDARGTILQIIDPAARTHVNARPVREKALLRAGDTVTFGGVGAVLKADRDELVEPAPPARAAAAGGPANPARAVLRGLSGVEFGKSIPIGRRLMIGRGRECDLVLDDSALAARQVALDQVDDAIHLRRIDDAPGPVTVNGVAVDDAVLHSGDQIVFAGHRFLLEAPGLPLRGQATPAPSASITQMLPGIEHADVPEAPAATARSGIAWLIGAAILIGLALAALLLWGTR
jgi:pSer/pThr/pTyr-binding forkhead associated (FHA) protein